MEQGEIEISPELRHSPDIEILPDDEVDLTYEHRRRSSVDRDENEEVLDIKPPQVHVSKKEKHKHKHKEDRKKDRERGDREKSSRHGDREKDRGKHKERRDKEKLPKEPQDERVVREREREHDRDRDHEREHDRERDHERERNRRKELEAEAKRREKSQRERDRLERLERERRKLEREREQREREHRERLKQEQERQERLAKVEREQERLAKAEREQERLLKAEREHERLAKAERDPERFIKGEREYERKSEYERLRKGERHRGSSEREYEKEKARAERSRMRSEMEDRRKIHSTRHVEVEKRREKDRSRDKKERVRSRSRSPYSKKDPRDRYNPRRERYHRHPHRDEEPIEEDHPDPASGQHELDNDLEHLYQQQMRPVSEAREEGMRDSEQETSSVTTSESESEDSDSDSAESDSAESHHSHRESRSHSEGDMSEDDHHAKVKSKFDDDDDEEIEEEEVEEHPFHHVEEDEDENQYEVESFPPSPNQSANEQEADYLESPPPESPIELAPELPPYLPAIQGCRNVEEFHCLNRIEEGTYGVVYRARDNKTGELVALKRLKMEKEKEGFPITSLREINTLLKAQHPNIVTVREIVVGSNMDKIYIVMDYVEHDLKSLMQTMKDPFIIGEVKTLMQQLLRGVAHLHDNWIIHRDLKTSNLLLSHNGILKIGDFGLAREYGSPLKPYTSIVVTLWYRSPELLLGIKEYSTYIDMWSVGCIFAEFLTMKPLFPGKSEIDQLNRVFKELGTPNEKIWTGVSELPVMKKCTFAEYPYNQLRNRFSSLFSDRGFDLLNRFLTYDPQRRVTAKEALQHQYFVESPLPISPSMFPTWPAKSEQTTRTHGNTPRPPSGGKAYAKLLGDDDEALAAGFHIGSSMKGSAATGFKLKF